MKDETREAVWNILKTVCNQRTVPPGRVCSHDGNRYNPCTPEACPVAPKLMKAAWLKPPPYPYLEPLHDDRG